MTPEELLDAIIEALAPIPGEPNSEFWGRSRALTVLARCSTPTNEAGDTLAEAYDKGWQDAIDGATIDEGYKDNPYAKKKGTL